MDACARLAEAEARLEQERRVHEEQVTRLSKALDQAQRVAAAAEASAKSALSARLENTTRMPCASTSLTIATTAGAKESMIAATEESMGAGANQGVEVIPPRCAIQTNSSLGYY